jgi:translation initiation factor 4G
VNTSKKISIRSAKSEDASSLAQIILMAGRAHVKQGIWEVILGGTEEECLAFLQLIAVTKIPHLFHYSCYLVAEVGGAAAGGLGGYDPRYLGYQRLRKAILEVVQKSGQRRIDPEAEKRSARISGCISDAMEGAWVIDSVATFPQFRRQGIASMLLEKILKKGRKLGFHRAQINMYIGNTPAQRVYEKLGFRVVEEKRDPTFESEIGSPGMLSLICNL